MTIAKEMKFQLKIGQIVLRDGHVNPQFEEGKYYTTQLDLLSHIQTKLVINLINTNQPDPHPIMGKGTSLAVSNELEIPRKREVDNEDGFEGYHEDYGPEPPTPLLKTSEKQLENVFFGSVSSKVSENQSILKNYGIIPLIVIHNVLLFSDLCEVLSVSLSCKLFNSVSQTQLFWKEYFHSFYKTPLVRTRPCDEKENETINWKKQFYKRYFDHSDKFYRGKYTILTNNRETKEEEKHRFGKICVAGGGGVGKTCFTHRLVGRPFSGEYVPTIEDIFDVEVMYKTVTKPACIKGTILDTAGQEEYYALWESSLRGSTGVFICVGVDDKSSIEVAEEILKLYLAHGNSRNVMILVLKSDLFPKSRSDLNPQELRLYITPEDLEKMKEKFLNTYGVKKRNYVEVSSKSDKNVYKAFGMMMDIVISGLKIGRVEDEIVMK